MRVDVLDAYGAHPGRRSHFSSSSIHKENGKDYVPHRSTARTGQSVTEGTVTRWLVEVGDTIEADAPPG